MYRLIALMMALVCASVVYAQPASNVFSVTSDPESWSACNPATPPIVLLYDNGTDVEVCRCIVTAWTCTVGTGGAAVTPGGSTTELQYNNASSFDGASGITVGGSEDTLTVSEDVTVGDHLEAKRFAYTYYADEAATGGTGTAVDPWTGWESTCFPNDLGGGLRGTGADTQCVFPNRTGGPGYYQTDNALVLGNHSSIKGYGPWSRSVIRPSGTFPTGSPMVELGRGSAVFGTTIEDLEIDCNASADATVGIYSERSNEHGGLFNVKVIDCTDRGVQFAHSTGASQMWSVKNVTVGVASTDASGSWIGFEFESQGAPMHEATGLSCYATDATTITGATCLETNGTSLFLSGFHTENIPTGIQLGDAAATSKGAGFIADGVHCVHNVTDCVEIVALPDADALWYHVDIRNIRCESANGCTNYVSDLETSTTIAGTATDYLPRYAMTAGNNTTSEHYINSPHVFAREVDMQGALTASGSGSIQATDVSCTDCVESSDITDSTIAAGDIADGDHGDFTYASNVATLDADVVAPAEMADADHGDFTYSAGVATLDADVVAPAEMADADHGDFTYASGVATLDANVVDSAEIATDAVKTDEIDQTISPTWTGTHTFGTGGIAATTGTGLIQANALVGLDDVFTVCATANQCDYSTIQSALDGTNGTAAAPITILVFPGTYTEDITIDSGDDFTHLQGFGRDLTIIDANTASGTTIDIDDTADIDGLSITDLSVTCDAGAASCIDRLGGATDNYTKARFEQLNVTGGQSGTIRFGGNGSPTSLATLTEYSELILNNSVIESGANGGSLFLTGRGINVYSKGNTFRSDAGGNRETVCIGDENATVGVDMFDDTQLVSEGDTCLITISNSTCTGSRTDPVGGGIAFDAGFEKLFFYDLTVFIDHQCTTDTNGAGPALRFGRVDLTSWNFGPVVGVVGADLTMKTAAATTTNTPAAIIVGGGGRTYLRSVRVSHAHDADQAVVDLYSNAESEENCVLGFDPGSVVAEIEDNGGTCTIGSFPPQVEALNLSAYDAALVPSTGAAKSGDGDVLLYDDTTQENASWRAGYVEPTYLDNGFVRPQFRVYWKPETATAEDVVWEFGACSVAEDEAYNCTPTTFTSVQDTVTGGAAGDVYVSAWTEFDRSELTAGEALVMTLRRDPADAADDMVGDAGVLAVAVKYSVR